MITLVGCGGSKLAAAAPARALYTSTLFRKSAAYAEHHGRWYIASALHGLLHPDTEIKPYDVRLGSGYGAPPIHQWADKLVADLMVAEPDLPTLTILAGKIYVDPIKWVLRDTEVSVFDPLAGLGIGQRLAWLTRENAAECNTAVDADEVRLVASGKGK